MSGNVAGIDGPRHAFTRREINTVPSQPGVYALWRDRSVVFLGAAVGDRGLREELESRLTGIRAPSLIIPSEFQFEVTEQALSRLAQLLKEYAGERGDVPLGNRSQIRVRPHADAKNPGDEEVEGNSRERKGGSH